MGLAFPGALDGLLLQAVPLLTAYPACGTFSNDRFYVVGNNFCILSTALERET